MLIYMLALAAWGSGFRIGSSSLRRVLPPSGCVLVGFPLPVSPSWCSELGSDTRRPQELPVRFSCVPLGLVKNSAGLRPCSSSRLCSLLSPVVRTASTVAWTLGLLAHKSFFVAHQSPPWFVAAGGITQWGAGTEGGRLGHPQAPGRRFSLFSFCSFVPF